MLERVKVVNKPNGRRFVYYRAPGGELRPLPPLEFNDPDFLAAYSREAAKVAAERAATTPGPRRTLADLAKLYFTSRRFLDLKPSSQDVRRRVAEAIVVKGTNAEGVTVAARAITRRHIQADIDKTSPGAASHRLAAWRALMRCALREEWIEADPSAHPIELPRYKKQSHPRWTAEDVKAFTKRWPVGTQQRVAFELFYWTGCRRGDAVRFGWQNVADGWMIWHQEKGGALVEQPIAPPLAAALAECPREGKTFLQTVHGKARSKKAFGNWFREACDAAGVDKSAHGLRHDFGSTISESGTDRDAGASAMGHSSVRQQETYRRSADRRRLTVKAMDALFSERGLETAPEDIGNRDEI